MAQTTIPLYKEVPNSKTASDYKEKADTMKRWCNSYTAKFQFLISRFLNPNIPMKKMLQLLFARAVVMRFLLIILKEQL